MRARRNWRWSVLALKTKNFIDTCGNRHESECELMTATYRSRTRHQHRGTATSTPSERVIELRRPFPASHICFLGFRGGLINIYMSTHSSQASEPSPTQYWSRQEAYFQHRLWTNFEKSKYHAYNVPTSYYGHKPCFPA